MYWNEDAWIRIEQEGRADESNQVRPAGQKPEGNMPQPADISLEN